MNRKLPRFSLKTFLLVTAVLAMVLGYVGIRIYRKQLRAEAAQLIQKEGGFVVVDSDKFITRILFDSNKLNDQKLAEMLKYLKVLPRLNELDLVRVEVTDEGVTHLEQLLQLKTLYLFETGITEKRIAQLKRNRPNLNIKTTRPDPIASTLIAATIYPHSIVGLDVTAKRIVIGAGDGIVRVLSVENRSQVAQWQAHKNWCFASRFSPDGRWLATGGGDNAIRIWDANTFELEAELIGHLDDVHSLVFSPHGRTLYSAGDDCCLRVWDLSTKKELLCLKGHTKQIPRIAIDASGAWLASASRDGTVRLWSTETGECKNVLSGSSADIMSVAFNNANQQLLCGDEDGIVRVWDMITFGKITEFDTELGGVFDLMVQSNGKALVACGSHGVKRWDGEFGISQAYQTDSFYSRIGSAVGALVVTNSEGQVVFLDDIRLEKLRTVNTVFGLRGF